jgi:1-phosphatidylinositol-4-phosphate 5-kinase
MGIIDIFTEYNGLKKLEYLYKSVKHQSNQMSCVPPEIYANRFVDFMKKCLVVDC